MISILMSVYNNENTIEMALESILKQSESDFELIIFDDASTDNTFLILQSYASEDSRIKLFKNQVNQGLAYSLNEGLKLAKGEYIARMDGDDVSKLNRLKIQKEYLDSHSDVDLVGTAMQVFDEYEDQEIIYTKEKPSKQDIPRTAPFSHATIMMKTEVLRDLGGYLVSKRTRRTEDMELWYRFFENGYIGVNLRQPLYKVRVDRKALRKRKLKDAIDASIITFQGVSRLQLPTRYYLYSIKPIISFFLPEIIKKQLRNTN